MAKDHEPDELDQRRRNLEGALAARRSASQEDGTDAQKSGKGSGFGNAFKLSSEFIAGIVAGIGLGWFFDRFFETSPWGLIIFLLLGFGAGVLNVLRAAGQVAEFGSASPKKRDDDSQRK